MRDHQAQTAATELTLSLRVAPPRKERARWTPASSGGKPSKEEDDHSAQGRRTHNDAIGMDRRCCRRNCHRFGARPTRWHASQRSAAALPHHARVGPAPARREVGRGHGGRSGARRVDLRHPSLLCEFLHRTQRSADPEIRPRRQTAGELGRRHVQLSTWRDGRCGGQSLGHRRAR